jgi:FKBP-type peptidyl-prolyl cis-trans isomerase FkpA
MRSTPRLTSRRIAAAIISLAIVSCKSSTAPAGASNPATETYAASLGVNLAQMTKVSDALYTQDLIVGTGVVLATGDSISVTYTGWLVNGTQFSPAGGPAPFQSRFGVGRFIQGWEIGLVGIRVGGKRRLVIGSDLAYGAPGQGAIPPNSTLVFDLQIQAKIP